MLLSYFRERESMCASGGVGEGESQVDSMLSVKGDMGLDPRTLKS